MKPATLLSILLTLAPFAVKGFSTFDDDFEDFALREYEDFALREYEDVLNARAEMLEEFSTRELIAELEDRLDAREEAVADAAGGAPVEGEGAAGEGGNAPPPPTHSLKKHKKNHKNKHRGGPGGNEHGKKYGKKGKKGMKGKKGKGMKGKKGLKGLKHHKAGVKGDISEHQSPPFVAPATEAN